MAAEWIIRESNLFLAESLQKEFSLSSLMARLLSQRISRLDEAQQYITPQLSQLPSPFLMVDMDRAVSRISQALDRRESIVIYGDYDADGVTGTSLLWLFLKQLGASVTYYIPHRLKEGYGLNVTALEFLKGRGAQLVITVDNGVASALEIEAAYRLGLDVIVVDHHHIPPRMPKSIILNPKREDCAYPDKNISAVGVVFNLLIALRSFLREREFFAREKQPDLREFLDLVAIGTIADLVPLSFVNRILVKAGLSCLSQRQRLGLKKLCEIAGLRSQKISSSDVGFLLAPRINAAGRLQDASCALRLLISDNEEEVLSLAKELDQENRRRHEIQGEILKQAIEMVERDPTWKDRASLVLYAPQFHIGVVGIVASKIVERFRRPTFILGQDGEKIKGSGRSQTVNLYEALSDCHSLLQTFGGHAYAAGLTLKEENLTAFTHALEETVKKRVGLPRQSTLYIDAEIGLQDIPPQFLSELEKLEPFGQGNKEPVFSISGYEIRDMREVGKGHLKLSLQSSGCYVSVIGFGFADQSAEIKGAKRLAVIPEANTYQGETSLQLRLADFKI